MALRPEGHRYVVRVVTRALDVLETLRDAQRPLSLQEISSRLGLVKSSGFRLLRTLEERGYVERADHDGRYSLGPEFLTFAQGSVAYRPLRDVARPHMERLLQRFGETVNLGVLRGTEVLYLEMLESAHAFRMTARVGADSPAHSTALGKAIAAHLTPDDLAALLSSQVLVALTPQTITSPFAWRRELARTRARGYAEDNGETEPEASCLAAPIFGADDRVVAAISLSGPTSRIRALKPKAVHALMASCRAISRALQTNPARGRERG